MGRKILAVVAGFVVWTIIWLVVPFAIRAASPGSFDAVGVPTTSTMMLVILLLSVICSLAGGWVTAKVATESAAKVVLILGIVLLLVGIAVQASVWTLMPVWYHLIFLVLLIPMAIVGGRLGGAS